MNNLDESQPAAQVRSEQDWWRIAGQEFLRRLDAAPAPRPPPSPPPRKPGRFDRLYRRHVLPDLDRMCRHLGARIAYRGTPFSDSLNEILREAYRRGAAHLADPLGLEDWLAANLCEIAAAAADERDRAIAAGLLDPEPFL